jgi:hypothetical protein
MKNELRWALLVLCYCGIMALNLVVEYPNGCIELGYQNSVDQGCVSGEQIRNGMFGLTSVFFIIVIGYEVWCLNEPN